MQRQLWQKQMNLTKRTYLQGMFGLVRLFAGSCLTISPLAPAADEEAKQQYEHIGTGGRLRC